MNKIVAQDFPKQALQHQSFQREILNDKDFSTEGRAVAALKIVEQEFMLRREFAKENGDTVHAERATKKILEIRTALTLIEYGLNDGEYPVNKSTPSNIVVS